MNTVTLDDYKKLLNDKLKIQNEKFVSKSDEDLIEEYNGNPKLHESDTLKDKYDAVCRRVGYSAAMEMKINDERGDGSGTQVLEYWRGVLRGMQEIINIL